MNTSVEQSVSDNDMLEVWKIIAQRRQARDSMVWQTAGLVFTGQAFLYSIALGKETEDWARFVALGLSVVSTIATMQVMARHRHFEQVDSEWLGQFEKNRFGKNFIQNQSWVPAIPTQ